MRIILVIDSTWQAAIAEQMGVVLIGHDLAAFKRLGAGYKDHGADEGRVRSHRTGINFAAMSGAETRG
jgi:hypothetical protein